MKLMKPICTKKEKVGIVASTTKNKKEKQVKVTRKLAAEELHSLASCYEKVAYSTVYKNCFYSKQYECWRYIGRAHNYSF